MSAANGSTTASALCACGCGTSLEGMKRTARYATGACKTRAYRERGSAEPQRRRVTSQPTRKGRDKTGVRVGYQRVLASLTQLPVRNGLVVATPAALERAVWEALPDRQRDRLRERQEAA